MVSRVNQLDAIHLNNEIIRLIRDEILENLQEISPVLISKYQPEIDLVIQSAVWIGSVGKHLSSFGQQILRLSYNSDNLTKSRLCLHFLLTVVPKYLNNINERRLLNRSWIHTLVIYGNNIALILSVVNFLRFLKTGRKPLLMDFLLDCDYVTLDSGQKRNLGYDFMTRELVWGGFMELFGMILPLINAQKINRFWKLNFNYSKSIAVNELKNPIFNLHTACAYCEERPSLPHHIGCGHIFCYYCIYANILTDKNYTCPLCDVKAIKIMPVVI